MVLFQPGHGGRSQSSRVHSTIIGKTWKILKVQMFGTSDEVTWRGIERTETGALEKDVSRTVDTLIMTTLEKNYRKSKITGGTELAAGLLVIHFSC